MHNNNGWVKIHRKLLENPISKKSAYFHLWVTLLLKANHEEEKFMWNGGIIIVKDGQFITGRKKLSEETDIPESTIEDILKFLETQHQIQQQKTTKYRLITILNWKTYQNSDRKSNNKATTSRHKQEIQEYKEDTSDKSQDVLISEIIKEFETVDPKNKTYYGNKTQRKDAKFLLEEYGLDEIKKRISFLPKSNKMPYFPKINSPHDLKEKWVTLEDAVERYKKDKKITKQTPNYII